MSAVLMLIATYVLPAIAGAGVVGQIGAIIESPAAGAVLKMGKRLAKGEHLSEEEKQIAAEYYEARSAQAVMHGVR